MPGWNDADFKGNFRVSRATFAYLVNELQPVLRRQEFLRSSIQSPEGNGNSLIHRPELFRPTKCPKEPVLLRCTMSDHASPFLTRI